MYIGQLSVTQKQGIITCIPKVRKSKFYIQKWRSISLLNVVYKSSIVSTDQNGGFVPGRYIGENTRIIYDFMQLTEDNNIPGFL